MKDVLRQAFYGVPGTLLAIGFIALFAVWMIGPPVMVAWEAIDLIRMREVAPAKVFNVKYVSSSKGSRAVITYGFSVQGKEYVSERYLPGFAGNSGTWTGGGEVGAEFPVGQLVPVYYSAADPTLCALEYGWFKWSVAITFFWIGLTAIGLSVSRMQASRWSTPLWCAGVACLVYGGAEVSMGPSAIRVRELHWHLLAWCAAVAGAAIYAWANRRFPLPAVDAIGAREASREVPDPEKSTPQMVLEWLIGTAMLAFAVRQSVLAINMNAWFAFFPTVFTIMALCFFVVCSRQLIGRVMWHRSHQ